MTGYKIYNAISIDGIHSGGKSIGTHGNKKIYIGEGIPGETVDVKVKKRQRGFLTGTIESIIQSSPHRMNPFCKHYHECGGCNWMHINYEHQLTLKKQILFNALQKYNIQTPAIPEVVPSPRKIYYRNKTEYAFSSNGNVLGFHPQNNPQEVFDVSECFLQNENDKNICHFIKEKALSLNIPFYSQQQAGCLKNLIIRTSTQGDVMILIGFMKNMPEPGIKLLHLIKEQMPDASLCYQVLEEETQNTALAPVQSFDSNPFYFEKMDQLTFRISASSFYQPNPEQAYQFYKKIKELADLKGNEFIYDLYTGAGTIALFLAQKAHKIIGIEGSGQAVEDAKFNAINNNIQNVTFLKGDILETFNSPFVEQHGYPDIIILDPPRSGTLIEIKKTILRAQPKKIIYVSCNPVSLAWDLKQLTEKYKVTLIQPFDAFPHTHHFETIVLLEEI